MEGEGYTMKRSTVTKGTAVLATVAIAALAVVPLSAGAATINSALLGGASSSDEAGEAFEWTDDADCTLCHAKQAESVENEDLLAYKHAALDCTFCHEYQSVDEDAADVDADTDADDEASVEADEAPAGDEDADDVEVVDDAETPSLTMAEVHANVTAVSTVKKSSLVNTSVDEAACLTCHDRDALIEATADCTVLTDAQGTVVNPHDLIEGSQHDQVTCEDCHKMHSNDSAAAYRACVSCHHAEVWECGTCHSYVANS
jgi:hypothetical protein